MSEGKRSPSDEGVFGFSEETLVVQHIRGLEAEVEYLKDQIRQEHAIKAQQGGSPCVCDVCRGNPK